MEERKNIGGFTLIELLVVLAVISLLSSIVLASLTAARVKAKNAAFAQAITQVQTALEIYKTKNGYYPDDDQDLGIVGQSVMNSQMTTPFRPPALIPTYVATFPGSLNSSDIYAYYTYSHSGRALFVNRYCGSRAISAGPLSYVIFYDATASGNSSVPLPRSGLLSGGTVTYNNYQYCVMAPE